MRIADSTVSGGIVGTEKIPVSPTAHITPNMLRAYANAATDVVSYTTTQARAAQQANQLVEGKVYVIVPTGALPFPNSVITKIYTFGVEMGGQIRFAKNCIGQVGESVDYIDVEYMLSLSTQIMRGQIKQIFKITDTSTVTMQVMYDDLKSTNYSIEDAQPTLDAAYRIISDSPIWDSVKTVFKGCVTINETGGEPIISNGVYADTNKFVFNVYNVLAVTTEVKQNVKYAILEVLTQL